MLTDDEPQDPILMGPEVRPRFQSDYEEQLEGSSAPEPAVAMAKRSRGRPAKSGKWQVFNLYISRKSHRMHLLSQGHVRRPGGECKRQLAEAQPSLIARQSMGLASTPCWSKIAFGQFLEAAVSHAGPSC